ncbi:hypothetical protein [Carnobacterium maltaromaticum]|uniref:hypothetical protein n=1 Tax=Carnobacterium maltaromaticum TaxID=2751 RepID=UPI00026C8D8F|nr:hypothetical protein [Carnobacterium maltaromaticum]
MSETSIDFKGKVYSKEDYSDNQLEQIKLAIEEGLNPNEVVTPNMQFADLVTWRQDERDKRTYSSKV